MNLLNHLTIKNLKLNKKRTVVTIIGIILSVALITAVASMYVSLIATMIRYETTQKGNFHTAFYNVPQSEIGTFTNNRAIEEIYVTQNIGYAKIEASKNEYKPYAYVKAFTKSALENLSIRLVSGRLPENTSEIVIPTHLKTNGRVTLNVGDSITLDIGKRVDKSGYELDQNTALITEGEKIIETEPVTYKIVGIIERPANNIEGYSAPGYTFITCDDNMTGTVDVFAKFTKGNIKNAYKITANILGVDENIFESFNKSKVDASADFSAYNEEMKHAKYDTSINTYLISLQTDPLNDNSIGELGGVVAVVCVIIIVTSVFCIKNSFDISITEKTKQYGMLRSIGATKKQIKKNVFYEATILGLIGIPLGILSGFFASYVLIIICNYLLVDIVAFGSTLIFEFSWWAVLAAFVLGTITIYFSALKSARRAAKVSPIDSIRNSGNIKIKPKKLRSPKIIKKIFGIGGEISYKNLKRNKKKYRTTVISIIVSVSVFIALYYFMSLTFKSVDYELDAPDYNLLVSMRFEDGNASYDNVLDITKLNDIENYTIRRSCSFDIESPRYSKDAESKNYAQRNNISCICWR